MRFVLQMGLGKTITCVSLIASTLESAKKFAEEPLVTPTPPPPTIPNIGALDLQPSHFAGSVWGMPPTTNASSSSFSPLVSVSVSGPGSGPGSGSGSGSLSVKAQAKQRAQDRAAESTYVRMKRLKVKSRGTLIICPLSTVSNWEDQFREHWGGRGVVVVGGNGEESSKDGKEKVKKERDKDKDIKCPLVKKERDREREVEREREKEAPAMGEECKKEEGEPSLPLGVSITSSSPLKTSTNLSQSISSFSTPVPTTPPDQKPILNSNGEVESKELPLRIYVYHGNARRPDPAFLADFDAVITTYATLASEYSKQIRSMDAEPHAGGGGGPSVEGEVDADTDMKGKKLCGMKRKKLCGGLSGEECASPLQMVYWFRVVLDEAQ